MPFQPCVFFILLHVLQLTFMQVIYQPSFISEWYDARSGDVNTSLLTIPHNLGEYPVKVDVQVKIIEGALEYIFSGIGSSQRDDDLPYDFGAVVYWYNDIHVQLGFPFLKNTIYSMNLGLAYTGAGTLYDGPPVPIGPYTNGQVRVRAWIATDLPSPVINMSTFVSRESGQNYRELSHALGFLPDIVTVRTLLDNGYMSDGIGTVFLGNTQKMYNDLGGVLYGYDDTIVRLWVPSYFKTDPAGHVFGTSDGYSFQKKTSGTAYILGWKIKTSQHVFHFQQIIGDSFIHDSIVGIRSPFDWTKYLVSVQYQKRRGRMLFYAAGTTQATPIARYGGFVYAYTKKEILLWHPKNAPVVYIGDRWGENQSAQESTAAKVTLRIFYLEEQKCPYPDNPVNSSLTMTGLRYGDTLSYSCNDGHVLIGGDLFRTCERTRKWSGSLPTCVYKELLLPKTCPKTSADNNESDVDLNKVLATMTVDKKTTTAYQRTITCADDKRISARVIGWSGVLIVSSVMAFFILPDFVTLFKHIFVVIINTQNKK